MLDCGSIKNMILKVASLKTNLPSKHISEYLPLATQILVTVEVLRSLKSFHLHTVYKG
jgi:hypothetical protein